MKKDRPRRAIPGAEVSAPFPAIRQNERDLVKLLARIAADKDYKAFLKSGKIPYDGSDKRRPS